MVWLGNPSWETLCTWPWCTTPAWSILGRLIWRGWWGDWCNDGSTKLWRRWTLVWFRGTVVGGQPYDVDFGLSEDMKALDVRGRHLGSQGIEHGFMNIWTTVFVWWTHGVYVTSNFQSCPMGRTWDIPLKSHGSQCYRWEVCMSHDRGESSWDKPKWDASNLRICLIPQLSLSIKGTISTF